MIGKPRTAFDEKLAIDYKWFDAQGHTPRYEFGYGLSYTTFELSDLRVRAEHHKDTAIHKTAEAHIGSLELYDTLYVVRVDVRNTGERDGSEVPQLVSLSAVGSRTEADRSTCHTRHPSASHCATCAGTIKCGCPLGSGSRLSSLWSVGVCTSN